ncbi:transcriptional regulator [Psychromonas sp. psych-6C06]|uniref:MurR/RpiR family transcriptional regulator n=1 Tax=Psychromonas sp. psych-6C06 TaxID=2058089 RepID=UPI000C3290BD|nr:MurR/RpiR family transcriptional regulator [Psychromonas sp. psych-6C06]PKF60397.1 transcriptional regulator [Psychromonas sp. psych-6C06]
MQLDVDIVSVINEKMRAFSSAEQKVAQLILKDLYFSANASIAEIAEAADVSEASITRFAKVVGCQNVRDMKMRIAQSLAVGQRFISDVPVESTGISAIYENIKHALNENATLISEDILHQATELVTKARQILVFGVGGGSTVLAQEIQHRLFRLGHFCQSYSDPMLMRMAASTSEKNDIVICLSLSGYSADVQESARIAKHNGCQIIAITQKGTPLCEAASLLLPIKIEESDYIFKPTASRYVMMAAIDVLVTEVAINQKHKTREKLRKLKVNLDNYRGKSDRLPLGD